MKKYITSIIMLFVFSCGFTQTKWMMINTKSGHSDSVLISQINKVTFETKANTIFDIDGNLYHTVVIGTQEWTVENLRVTHYNDGTSIPKVTENSDWTQQTTGAFCAYGNNENNVLTYGYLYNWYAVNNGKLPPLKGGWRVPSDADWTTLINYSGGPSNAGKILKSVTGWQTNNGTDHFGFTALPGGYRDDGDGGLFYGLGIGGNWWSSSSFNSTNGITIFIHHAFTDLITSDDNMKYGFSVRLIRDL